MKKNSETFVMYIAVLEVELLMLVYPTREAQIFVL